MGRFLVVVLVDAQNIASNGDIVKKIDTVTENIAILQQAVNQLTDDVRLMDDRILPKDEVQSMIVSQLDTVLQQYSTTTQIQRIIGDYIAALNREIKDGFTSINQRFDTFGDGINQRISDHDSKLGHAADELLVINQRQGDLERNYDQISHAQGENAVVLNRIDESIRGDGQRPGLVSRVVTVETALPVLERSFTDAMNGIHANTDLLNEMLTREKAREDARARQERRRRQLLLHVKDSAQFIIVRGLAWGLGTGILGTTAIKVAEVLLGG